jgi:hypothetical protein
VGRWLRYVNGHFVAWGFGYLEDGLTVMLLQSYLLVRYLPAFELRLIGSLWERPSIIFKVELCLSVLLRLVDYSEMVLILLIYLFKFSSRLVRVCLIIVNFRGHLIGNRL